VPLCTLALEFLFFFLFLCLSFLPPHRVIVEAKKAWVWRGVQLVHGGHSARSVGRSVKMVMTAESGGPWVTLPYLSLLVMIVMKFDTPFPFALPSLPLFAPVSGL
jgi:Na+/H+ antiporter NhaC